MLRWLPATSVYLDVLRVTSCSPKPEATLAARWLMVDVASCLWIFSCIQYNSNPFQSCLEPLFHTPFCKRFHA